jgi:hypothetical protein
MLVCVCVAVHTDVTQIDCSATQLMQWWRVRVLYSEANTETKQVDTQPEQKVVRQYITNNKTYITELWVLIMNEKFYALYSSPNIIRIIK